MGDIFIQRKCGYIFLGNRITFIYNTIILYCSRFFIVRSGGRRNGTLISFLFKMAVNCFSSFFFYNFFFLSDLFFYSTGPFAVKEFTEIICFAFHGIWGEAFLLASCPQAASISFPRLLRSLALTLFFSRCFM